MPTKNKARNKLRGRDLNEKVAQSETHLGNEEFCITSLLVAVAEQNLEELARCLSEGHDVHDSAFNACTPLILAVKLGNMEMVNMLLQHKASTHAADSSGATVLHHAAINGFAEIASCLVTKGGAVLDQPNKAGCTPLYQAVQHGHVDCVRTLLALGADLEARTRTGATPLYIASDRGHVGLANILLSAGADANASTIVQMTPLLVASFNGHRDVVSLFLSHNVDIEQRGPCGGTPLYVSAQEGRESVAELLIQHRANVDARCDADSDLTPSLIAAMQGHDGLVRLLLEAKSDIGTTTGKGSTLAVLAARHGRTNVLKVLVDFVGPKVLHDQNAAGLSILDISKSARNAETTSYIKTVLAAQRESDMSAWEANLPEILEELDPPSKKQSKSKSKRKRKVNANCTSGVVCCGVADAGLPSQATALQDSNTRAEMIGAYGSDSDVCDDQGKSQDFGCKGIVKPMNEISQFDSLACDPQEHLVPLKSPTINISIARPLTPLPATPLASCETTSPRGFCTVWPPWPSTPESWPSLPPAVSLDTIDIALQEKSQSTSFFPDFSLPPWQWNSNLGVNEYCHSAFLDDQFAACTVPAVLCGSLNLSLR